MNKFSPVPEIKSLEEKKNYKSVISKHFSSKSDYWNLVYDKNHDPLNLMNEDFRKRKDTVLQYFAKYCNNSVKQALDLGCGTGIYLREIIERGFCGIGIDISFDMVSSANEKLDTTEKSFFIQGDIEKLPFGDNSFECIICAGTLEFLPDLKSALSEIRRILMNSGIFIATFPNAVKLKNIFDPMFYYSYISRKRKNVPSVSALSDSNFSGKKFLLFQIIKMLRNSGFLIKELRGIGFGPIQFFRKDLFSPERAFRINERVQRIADKSLFNYLYNISNRWVLCLQKIS